MDIKDWYNSEPAKYWQPDKSRHIELDIIENPSKYDEYIGSYKKDGEWARVIIDDGSVIVQSRSISKVTGTYGRKEELIPHLVELFKKLPNNTVLLGELYFNDLSKHSKDVGSILRCLPPKAIARQKNNPLHFYCFDVLMWNGQDIHSIGYQKRCEYLSKVREICGDTLIEYAKLEPIEQIVEQYDEYLKEGGEGFVLQKKSNPYNPGTRTAWATIKLKKAIDEIELPVVGIVWPNREYDGKELENWQYYEGDTPVTKRYYLGYANGVTVDNNGTLVKITSGITDEDAAWLATNEAKTRIENREVFAKVAAMEIEKDSNSLRHPSLIELRTDL